jgi:hypothetical protein
MPVAASPGHFVAPARVNGQQKVTNHFHSVNLMVLLGSNTV